MKLGIIDSAFQQAGVDKKSGLEHIARIGFDCVDIFTEAMSIIEKDISLIEQTCSDNNLPITSLPVVAAGLIDFSDPVREFHLNRCKKFIDLCARFKADNLLLVLGEYIWQKLFPRKPNGSGPLKTPNYLGTMPQKKESRLLWNSNLSGLAS